MMPSRHPGDPALVDYAAGRLNEAMALAVATHLALCPDCRPRVAQVETLGGILLDELAPATMSVGGLDWALAKLDEAAPTPPRPAPATAETDFAWPAPLCPYFAPAMPSWRFVAPGVRQIVLVSPAATGGSARLLRVAPGRAMAHHGHRGREMSVVLAGAYTDEFGLFGPGDFAELDEAAEHRPVAAPGDNCLCLIATDGRLRFSGWLGRLLQPLLGV